jgi:dTDP-3-amino-3,4,6-trideoxy-alpha-D-glucose transaminase
LYREQLSGLRELKVLEWDEDSAHHLFVVRLRHRERVRAALAASGIQTGIHYPVPLHLQSGFQADASWREPPGEAERAADEVLSLPIGPHITSEHVVQIAAAIRSTCP